MHLCTYLKLIHSVLSGKTKTKTALKSLILTCYCCNRKTKTVTTIYLSDKLLFLFWMWRRYTSMCFCTIHSNTNYCFVIYTHLCRPTYALQYLLQTFTTYILYILPVNSRRQEKHFWHFRRIHGCTISSEVVDSEQPPFDRKKKLLTRSLLQIYLRVYYI